MKLNYGEALKEHRKAYGYTQERLAKETGIFQPNISAWENNVYAPSIDFCVQLADFYGITLDELVGRDYGREKPVKVEYNHSTHNGNNIFR